MRARLEIIRGIAGRTAASESGGEVRLGEVMFAPRVSLTFDGPVPARHRSRKRWGSVSSIGVRHFFFFFYLLFFFIYTFSPTFSSSSFFFSSSSPSSSSSSSSSSASSSSSSSSASSSSSSYSSSFLSPSSSSSSSCFSTFHRRSIIDSFTPPMLLAVDESLSTIYLALPSF